MNMMNRDEENSLIASSMMAKLLSIKDDKGEYITERLTVADLWRISAIAVPIVREHLSKSAERLGGAPPDLNSDELLVWGNSAVRGFIRDGQKIQAIKEARSLTGMSLKEAKDFVERMEAMRKATGGTGWVL
jgi:ribosomal protein L7/L12